MIQDTPSSVTFPGGESMLGMAQRATAAVADWSAQHPEGVVAVVSHGDVIKAILSDALGQPLDKFQRIVVGPGSLSVVRYHGDRAMVLRMNDTGRSLPIHARRGPPHRRRRDRMSTRRPGAPAAPHPRAGPARPG